MEYKNSAGSWTSLSGGVATNFAAGSVGAPGLSVTGDANTGLYQATADTLSITAGGVEAARFNTAASGVNYLTVTPSATTAAVQLATAGTDSNISLAIMPKGTGNVGIGTASPAAKLHVLGTSEQLRLGNNQSNYVSFTTGTSGQFTLAPTGDEVYLRSNQNFGIYLDHNNNDGSNANFDIYSNAGGTHLFRVQESGNVGIGTATPAEKLEVAGNIKASGTLQVANSAATCTGAADYGKFRYNPVNGKLQICKP
jgi:hypothetical protein